MYSEMTFCDKEIPDWKGTGTCVDTSIILNSIESEIMQ